MLSKEAFMAHRANFILEDEVWDGLQAVPKGERSRFVNRAVDHELAAFRRRQAVAHLDKIRARMTPVAGHAEDWIREDREHH